MKIMLEVICWMIILLNVALLDTGNKILKIIMIILNAFLLFLTLTTFKMKADDEYRYFPQRIYYGSIFLSIFGIIIYLYLIYNP